MKRLALTTGVVTATYGALSFHDSAKPPAPSDWIDVAIVSGFGIGLTLAALVMVAGTRKWSARQMGLFWTTAASALLWDGQLWSRLESRFLPEWYTDLLRACLIVGIPLFILGLIVWVKARIKQAIPEDVIEPRHAGEMAVMSVTEGANS